MNQWRRHSRMANDTRPEHKWEIRRRFRRLRKKVRLTQARLGSLIGLSQKAVSQIECRRVRPRPSTWRVFEEFESVRRQRRIRFPKIWD